MSRLFSLRRILMDHLPQARWELVEWEQVARFIREDRARRREREAIVR